MNPMDERLDDEFLRLAHQRLLSPRIIEERMTVLLRQGHISKWFSGIGQEAVSVGSVLALDANDYILPTHRNLGVFTTRDVDLDKLFAQLLGQRDGFTNGRDRSFHFGDLSHRIVGMISHLGSMLPVACGLGLAAQMEGHQSLALAFLGDGASSEGDVHEAMNLASVWSLPVIFMIENNQYALSTPTRQQYACASLADRAMGYGMPGTRIDGNDINAVYNAVKQAAERARKGDGPSVIEAVTFRMRGHEETSGVGYVPKELLTTWSEQDPIARVEAELVRRGLESADSLSLTKDAIRRRIYSQLDSRLESTTWHSAAINETDAVYAKHEPAPPEPSPGKTKKRYIDAIAEALSQQMEADPRTILLGQDIAEYGGVFKVTDGLVEVYGEARVRNTPIIESGAIGCALGLALAGYRPMVEMQFADFIACGFNQIINNLAPTHYRWGAPVPVVIRAPQGGGVGAGPFHSQCIESYFASVPGLKIVAPASPFDAKGLLLEAFADPNPVLFLEHKKLYRTMTDAVPEQPYRVPFGRARTIESGTDLTIVTYGLGVHWAVEAAARFRAQNTHIEVIDLRSLKPWDRVTVFESVKRTGRALVLTEGTLTGGFGGELAAEMSAECFEWLDAPVRRIASLDTPVPFAATLEQSFLPVGRIDEEIERLLRY